MPLTPVPPDGYSTDARIEAQCTLSRLWDEYVEDCEEGNSKPDVDDFAVWLIRIRAFKDGMEFARDDADEPPEG